jgi:hypothetical protein
MFRSLAAVACASAGVHVNALQHKVLVVVVWAVGVMERVVTQTSFVSWLCHHGTISGQKGA